MIAELLIYILAPAFILLILNEYVFKYKRGIPYGDVRVWLPVRLLSHTMDQLTDFDMSIQKKRFEQYGQAVRLTTILGDVILLHGPELLKWAFKGDRKYIEWELPKHWQPLLGWHSIFNAKGEAHKRLRRILSVAFTPVALSHYLPFAQQCTVDFLDSVTEFKEHRDIYQNVKALAMNIALRIILGEDMNSDKRLQSMMLDYTEWLGGLAALIPYRIPGTALDKAHKAKDRILATLKIFLEERKKMSPEQLSEKKDVLQNLINARDDDGSSLDDDVIVETLIGFIFAGHDTSTATICSCLYLYAMKCPSDFKEKMITEVKDAFPQGTALDYEKLVSLPYLDAFFKESLRILGPIPAMSRVVIEDDVQLPPVSVGNSVEPVSHQLKKGDILSLDYSVIMHQEKYFENAEKFIPSRFLPENDKTQPYTYVPFGGGARMCLGMNLAKMEIKCFMAEIIRQDCECDVQDYRAMTFPFYMVSPKIKITRAQRF